MSVIIFCIASIENDWINVCCNISINPPLLCLIYIMSRLTIIPIDTMRPPGHAIFHITQVTLTWKSLYCPREVLQLHSTTYGLNCKLWHNATLLLKLGKSVGNPWIQVQSSGQGFKKCSNRDSDDNDKIPQRSPGRAKVWTVKLLLVL